MSQRKESRKQMSESTNERLVQVAGGHVGGAANHRGSSEQTVCTPQDLIGAVENRFGAITFDLAASDADDALANQFFTPDDDSLSPRTRWPASGVLWLNPPFGNVEPWVQRCARWVTDGSGLLCPAPDSLLLLLVPASVDSNWWMRHVAGHARVLALNPRVKFKGHAQGFPKPLALCVYDPRFHTQPALVEPWRWKK